MNLSGLASRREGRDRKKWLSMNAQIKCWSVYQNETNCEWVLHCCIFLFVIFFFYRRKKLILNYELFAWRTYLLIHEILNTLQHQIPDWNSCSWHSREAKGEEKQQVRLLQTINQMKHMKIQINESTVSTLRHRFTWEGRILSKSRLPPFW